MASSLHPVEAPGSRPTFRWIYTALAVLAAVVVVLLYLRRPDGQFYFPRCTFHQMTGLLCPGCGGLRATHEVLNGRLLEAARCNLLFVGGVPTAIVAWLWARRGGRRAVVTVKMVWFLFAVAALFTVLRNVPGLPSRWLAP